MSLSREEVRLWLERAREGTTGILPKSKPVFINLTPHEINIYDESGELVETIPPSGKVLRLPTTDIEEFYIGEFPVRVREYTLPEDFPEPARNVYYIVSLPVLMALAVAGIERPDMLAPDTSKAIRDEKGRIIGVTGFVRLF